MTLSTFIRIALLTLLLSATVAADVTVFVGSATSSAYSNTVNASGAIYAVQSAWLGNGAATKIIDDIDRLMAVDYEPNSNKIFYSSGQTIYKADIDGSNIEVFKTDQKLGRGLTIDAQNNLIFWTHYDSDTEWEIRKSALFSDDTTIYETVLVIGRDSPYQLSLNIASQSIFFVLWPGTVKFTDYNGESVTTALTLAGNEINGTHIIGFANNSFYGAITEERGNQIRYYSSFSNTVSTFVASTATAPANGYQQITGAHVEEADEYLLFSAGGNSLDVYFLEDGGNGGTYGPPVALPFNTAWPVVSSPMVDSDADGVPDETDVCENAADTDSDNDGSPDCQDSCDEDPGKREPGVCGCGVADADSDSDGSFDCQESCDADPLKATPGICGCGLSDVDTDNDGTADCNDACPNDANKVEPGDRGCGSPEFNDLDDSLDNNLDDLDDINDPNNSDDNAETFDKLIDTFDELLDEEQSIAFKRLRKKLRKRRNKANRAAVKATAEGARKRKLRFAVRRFRRAIRIARKLVAKLNAQKGT